MFGTNRSMTTNAMTFEEFRQTRKPADARDMQAAGYECGIETTSGYLYADSLVIESTSEWQEAIRSKPYVKRYYLMIGNAEYFSDDLESLWRVCFTAFHSERSTDDGTDYHALQ
jgi:hypothetical protein